MCHKCRGGACKETKSIIASTKTRAFLDGQVSVAGVPSKVPSSSATTIQEITEPT
jgi:hypothetical protein